MAVDDDGGFMRRETAWSEIYREPVCDGCGEMQSDCECEIDMEGGRD